VEQSDEKAIRSALQSELSRMKKLGFFVVEEAFDVAQTLDLAECSNLPLTDIASIASKRGFEQFKSRVQREDGY
jgi:hypothetical protein